MLFFFLFFLSQENKKFCICNNECHPLCSFNIFNASIPFPRFEDFILSKVKREEEIDLDFYSKHDNFEFTMDLTNLDDLKITLKTMNQSKPIIFKIKQKSQVSFQSIEIKPNFKVILPYLSAFPANIIPFKKNILSNLDSSFIPISIGIASMNPRDTSKCTFGNNNDHEYDSSQTSQDYDCNTNNLAFPEAYQCGLVCYGSDSKFDYTFRGVKFALYGKNHPSHGKFKVLLDGEFLTEIDEAKNEANYVLLYTSPLLQYGDHKIDIVPEGIIYEFYKLVFWPSMNAKRFNATSFAISSRISLKESDGIGGVRYRVTDGTAIVKLNCIRFWLYGMKGSGEGIVIINYDVNNYAEQIECNSNKRDEGALLHDSGYLSKNDITITLKFGSTSSVAYCIYYEELPIPMSIGMWQMNPNTAPTCGSLNLPNSTEYMDMMAWEYDCEYNNLDLPEAYNCGLICFSSSTKYNYLFKGVKFAIYGSNNMAYDKFQIKLNGSFLIEINEKKPAAKYIQLYESDILEYGNHYVEIIPMGMVELYKLSYWPSITAKRANVTQFLITDSWNLESDGIGGNRYWWENGGIAIIPLQCSKFWIYGVTYPNDRLGDLTIKYNGITETIILNTGTSRREGVLQYESPELSISSMVLKFSSDKRFHIYCIYYEISLTPEVSTVPMSVSLQQTTHSESGFDCSNHKDNKLNIANSQPNNFGCEFIDLESVNAYHCGIKCRGKNIYYSYTFKGVKFAIYGKYHMDNRHFTVELDGVKIAVIDEQAPELSYAILYESEVINYKEHTVTISSDDFFEIYKIVYWPSTRAKRLNSTDFDKGNFANWIKETDGIGGVREYTQSTDSFSKTFSCSRFWLYASTDKNLNGMKLTYNGYTEVITENSPSRFDNVLLKESEEFELKSISLQGDTLGNCMLYCLFYQYGPFAYEYINKTFKRVLPFFHILVLPLSLTNEISGCEFIDIYEDVDYFIILHKEIIFKNNIFRYISEPIPAAPINISYNGKLIILNSTFENSRNRNAKGANVFYCSQDYSIDVTFQSCTFNNCGNSDSQSIILIESSNSIIDINDCVFITSYKNIGNSAQTLMTSSSSVNIYKSKFYKSGKININANESTKDHFGISFDRCIFDSCTPSSHFCFYIKISQAIPLTFSNSIITNIKLANYETYSFEINANNQISELVFQNISFIDNSCNALYRGGSGGILKNIPKLTFKDCNFIGNLARNSGSSRLSTINYPSGDGGGIQIGFYCGMKESILIFSRCNFSKNHCYRHGGALAIQTIKVVEITNCTFESNVAYDQSLSSAELLYENHYNKKTQGKGGAIYINPTFTYNTDECSNSDAHMTSFSIENCIFSSNSAHDGFAMYIEGDDPHMNFNIVDNEFNDNFNFGPTADNLVRGVIATEIFTVNENDIVNKNKFTSDPSHKRPKKLIYVDHYGIRMATKPFSHSKMFTNTIYFSESEKFTKSNAFSCSDSFTKSTNFTSSNKFSESESKKFTKSDDFSDSMHFTNSKRFIESFYFSSSKKFSNSNEFTQSFNYFASEKFTKIKDFTQSHDFLSTYKFSNSLIFSSSDNFKSYSFEFAKTNIDKTISATYIYEITKSSANTPIIYNTDQTSNTNSEELTKLDSYTDFSIHDSIDETLFTNSETKIISDTKEMLNSNAEVPISISTIKTSDNIIETLSSEIEIKSNINPEIANSITEISITSSNKETSITKSETRGTNFNQKTSIVNINTIFTSNTERFLSVSNIMHTITEVTSKTTLNYEKPIFDSKISKSVNYKILLIIGIIIGIILLITLIILIIIYSKIKK